MTLRCETTEIIETRVTKTIEREGNVPCPYCGCKDVGANLIYDPFRPAKIYCVNCGREEVVFTDEYTYDRTDDRLIKALIYEWNEGAKKQLLTQQAHKSI